MPVPQHVLNWLYSVLTSEYLDVNRTYNDVARVITDYPSLTPRTDVYTFPDGTSALLLHISGTLPILFRGVTYRFPVSLWVPHKYPREPPHVYVVPTGNMAVRPGQHVDPQGQIYHPYLNHWPSFWDKSTLLDFLAILTDIFAKEPPVISRQHQHGNLSISSPALPLPPPPPPRQSPPPPPPPGATDVPGQNQQHIDDRPPPLPPLPSEMGAPHCTDQRPTPASALHPIVVTPSHGREACPPLVPPKNRGVLQSLGPPPDSSILSRYDSAPPLPPSSLSAFRSTDNISTCSNSPPPAPLSHLDILNPQRSAVDATADHRPSDRDVFHNVLAPHPFQRDEMPHWQLPFVQQQPPATHQLPRDLLDEPLPSSGPPSPTTPPPVPPNPERDALIQQLMGALFSLRLSNKRQNESSLTGLHVQRVAMQSAAASLHSEIGVLNHLSALLASNANILHETIHKADAVIEGSRSHPDTDIDELLVAPTVVANQLYTLVAEERAIGDAVFVIGRAMERGRISTAVFAKTTRSLAREWFLKKALIRKIARGMALS